MTIRFYRQNDPYGYMSNFSSHPVELDGRSWPTTEHYFQAQKFAGTPHEETIRRASSPAEAARRGRDRKLPLREDWESVKDGIMRKAVLAKFTQHLDLKRLLLETGDDELVEDTTRDHYWGCGTRKNGKNMLGKILMEVRSALREASRPDEG